MSDNNIVQKNSISKDKIKVNLSKLLVFLYPVLFGCFGAIFWAIGSYISVGLSFCIFVGIGLGFIASCIFHDLNK